MKITIQLVGRYKDIIRKPAIDLEMKSGSTVWHVIDIMVQRYPALEKDKKFMMILKNGALATRDININEGDIVTLAPPVVSGG
jgi:molybdopterin converting factor small subunit